MFRVGNLDTGAYMAQTGTDIARSPRRESRGPSSGASAQQAAIGGARPKLLQQVRMVPQCHRPSLSAETTDFSRNEVSARDGESPSGALCGQLAARGVPYGNHMT